MVLVGGSFPGLWGLGLLLRDASSPGVVLVGVPEALLRAESICPMLRGPERNRVSGGTLVCVFPFQGDRVLIENFQ